MTSYFVGVSLPEPRTQESYYHGLSQFTFSFSSPEQGRNTSFFKGDNNKIVKIHWSHFKIVNGPISAKLGTKHPFVRGFQVYSNGRPCSFWKTYHSLAQASLFLGNGKWEMFLRWLSNLTNEPLVFFCFCFFREGRGIFRHWWFTGQVIN